METYKTISETTITPAAAKNMLAEAGLEECGSHSPYTELMAEVMHIGVWQSKDMWPKGRIQYHQGTLVAGIEVLRAIVSSGTTVRAFEQSDYLWPHTHEYYHE